MENSIIIRIPSKAKDILMNECKELYLNGSGKHRNGCYITIGEMIMEVITFYRDADGIIFRIKPEEKK